MLTVFDSQYFDREVDDILPVAQDILAALQLEVLRQEPDRSGFRPDTVCRCKCLLRFFIEEKFVFLRRVCASSPGAELCRNGTPVRLPPGGWHNPDHAAGSCGGCLHDPRPSW